MSYYDYGRAKIKGNKTGLQPVSRACGTTHFGVLDRRRNKNDESRAKEVKGKKIFVLNNQVEGCPQ